MPSQPRNDLQPSFTRDERARKRFTSNLRAHVLGGQAKRLRKHYDDTIAPEFERQHGRLPVDGAEVRREMLPERDFRFFSSVRTCAQEMVFASVIPAVDREMEALAEKAADYSADGDNVGGTLVLNHEIDAPDNVSRLDVHLSPGSFHSEYTDNDVSAGAIYDSSLNVFAFGQFGADSNDVGMTMANFIRLRFPDLNPEKILDCGCTVGHNTLPFATTFPDAEVHAIDVAPGVLRYANARAQAMGVPVHFEQMNATELDYPDASFDIVFSSMFLHELPLRDIKAYFREAHRVLKPGGLLWTMELPPNSAMGAYEGFHLDWDTYYNNEPHYKPFRDQDYRKLCMAGGFESDAFLEATLPRYTFVDKDTFEAAVNGPAVFDGQTGRMDPKGTRWYGFGAVKR